MDIVNENLEEGYRKGLIIGAFSVFLASTDNETAKKYLEENNVKFGDEIQVRTILQNKDKGQVELFIKFLRFNQAL